MTKSKTTRFNEGAPEVIPDAPSTSDATIEIMEMRSGRIAAAVVGISPLIFNRLSEKAKRELLFPAKKSRADRDQRLKHDPMAEFRNSVFRMKTGPTLLGMPASAFKGAMMTAALDIPGTRRTEIGRLCGVDGYTIAIYGVPEFFMVPVRSAGMDRTPDIRTRAILPQWAAVLSITFAQPKLTAEVVIRLLAAAGALSGVGDFRQEKGKGDFGRFRTASEDDEAFQTIIREGGRAAQENAIANPAFFDSDSEELMMWYNEEILLRGRSNLLAPADEFVA